LLITLISITLFYSCSKKDSSTKKAQTTALSYWRGFHCAFLFYIIITATFSDQGWDSQMQQSFFKLF